MSKFLKYERLAHAFMLLLAAWLMLRIYNVVDGTEFMGHLSLES